MATSANAAFTAPINPPGAKPLTQDQVWEGLVLKVREANRFLAAIKDTRVLDEGTSTTDKFPMAVNGTPYISREAEFLPGQGPPAAAKNNWKVVEHCFLYEPAKVDFIDPGGNVVSNLISIGAGGRKRASDGADDLYLTYSFTWQPQPGEDVAARRATTETGAKTAVEHSIESLRQLVADGTIKA